MPVLSKFYGILIKMYFQQSEHNPPHIHAIYGEHIAAIDIKTGRIIEGNLPNRALSLVQEWVKENKAELLDIWNTQQFKKINHWIRWENSYSK